ncbi:hypothetical protein HDU76_000563 [Blyttiomyces sp. JEL0837]|nr:hypothetical protein HDU76_000563 [Blyttiomyces sp. JEL0837]
MTRRQAEMSLAVAELRQRIMEIEIQLASLKPLADRLGDLLPPPPPAPLDRASMSVVNFGHDATVSTTSAGLLPSAHSPSRSVGLLNSRTRSAVFQTSLSPPSQTSQPPGPPTASTQPQDPTSFPPLVGVHWNDSVDSLMPAAPIPTGARPVMLAESADKVFQNSESIASGGVGIGKNLWKNIVKKAVAKGRDPGSPGTNFSPASSAAPGNGLESANSGIFSATSSESMGSGVVMPRRRPDKSARSRPTTMFLAGESGAQDSQRPRPRPLSMLLFGKDDINFNKQPPSRDKNLEGDPMNSSGPKRIKSGVDSGEVSKTGTGDFEDDEELGDSSDGMPSRRNSGGSESNNDIIGSTVFSGTYSDSNTSFNSLSNAGSANNVAMRRELRKNEKTTASKSLSRFQTPEEADEEDEEEEEEKPRAKEESDKKEQTVKVEVMDDVNEKILPRVVRPSLSTTITKYVHAVLEKVVAKPKADQAASTVSLDQMNDKSGEWRYLEKGIHPRSAFSMRWDFIMSVVYIGSFWFIPIMLAFEVRGGQIAITVILTILYTIDSCVEFMTFRYDHSCMKNLSSPNLAIWHSYYLRNHAFIDLITSIPFDLLPIPSGQDLLLIRVLRTSRLPAIMMRSPVYRALRTSLEVWLGIGQAFSGIFALIFALAAFLHFQACMLFFVGRSENFSNPIIADTVHSSRWEKYTWALFQAVGNTFPMVYKPSTMPEQWLTITFIIVGAALYATIVGTLSSFAMGMDASGKLYRQKMDELQDYMNWKNLNPITRRKVMKYYEIKYRGKFFEENTLLGEMNESLRTEIAVHNCKELIQKVPFLRRQRMDGRDDQFIGRIATSLTTCYFVAGDVIVTQGELGSEMFFLFTGAVNVIVNGVVVASLKEGCFFGEVALIANIPRTATIQAGQSCMIYRLTRSDFMSILSEFEDMRILMDNIYQERMNKVRQEEEARRKKAEEEAAAAAAAAAAAGTPGTDATDAGNGTTAAGPDASKKE